MTAAIGMKGRGQGIARIASHRMLEPVKNNALRMAIHKSDPVSLDTELAHNTMPKEVGYGSQIEEVPIRT
jgi:hypothetical protein